MGLPPSLPLAYVVKLICSWSSPWINWMGFFGLQTIFGIWTSIWTKNQLSRWRGSKDMCIMRSGILINTLLHKHMHWLSGSREGSTGFFWPGTIFSTCQISIPKRSFLSQLGQKLQAEWVRRFCFIYIKTLQNLSFSRLHDLISISY